jgi:YidC/Oxa1 family membrane protein insertase
MSEIFNLILIQPLYNALVAIISIMPGHNIALGIITLTVIIKFLLMPLYHKSALAQKQLRELEPEMKQIKEEYVGDKQIQAQKIMELYQKHGINPFASFLLLLIQLPVILALFLVFKNSFELNLGILYSFITVPEVVSHTLFGLISISDKSIILALLVGVTQFIQMKLSLPPLPAPNKKKANELPSFKDDFARSMNLQMRYGMPVIITIVATQFPAALSLYWLTGNVFSIVHELFVKKQAESIKNTSK